MICIAMACSTEDKQERVRIHCIAVEGEQLRVFDFQAQGERAVGIVIAGHDWLTESGSLCAVEPSCLVQSLQQAGFRVLVPDLRGHGQSDPAPQDGGDWSYDDLVEDVGSYIQLAKKLEARCPLFLLGHGLFGQLCLAWLSRHGRSGVRALLCLGVDLWNRRFEPSRRRWLVKRVLLRIAASLATRWGYFPGKLLTLGGENESRAVCRQLHEFSQRNHWRADDGFDYWEGTRRLDLPVLWVLSTRDRLVAHVRSSLSFSSPLRNCDRIVLGREDDRFPELLGLAPSHRGMVRDPRSAPLWRYLRRWMIVLTQT